VLRVRGIESEAQIPFGSLLEFLRPALGMLDAIPEPQTVALEGALALRRGAAQERFAVGAAPVKAAGPGHFTRFGDALPAPAQRGWCYVAGRAAWAVTGIRRTENGVAGRALEPEEQMTVVQFTRFRVTARRERAVRAARLAALQACRGGTPELEAAYLVRLADGDWLDIAVWAGQPRIDALDDPEQAASRGAFYDQIDELLGEECGILVHPRPWQ